MYVKDRDYFGCNGLACLTKIESGSSGYNSLRRLRYKETLDLSSNMFNNSILAFISAATSLTTLFLHHNYLDGHFPFKELKSLKNLELLDLSWNRFNGSMKTGEFPNHSDPRPWALQEDPIAQEIRLSYFLRVISILECFSYVKYFEY